MNAAIPAPAGLTLTGARAGYGRTVVLDGITLSLAPGSTLALLGRNGVGKTTLLATVMGLTTLHGGSIRFNDEDIGKLPPYERCERGIGFVPQEREIFPSLTLEENLDVAARPGRWTIERVFQQITEVFNLQHLIGTTPQGTLFQLAFCLLLYNMLQLRALLPPVASKATLLMQLFPFSNTKRLSLSSNG